MQSIETKEARKHSTVICFLGLKKSDLLRAIHGKPSHMKLAWKFSAIVWPDCDFGSSMAQAGIQPAAKEEVWVVSWGASQQVPEPQNAIPADDLRDATIRQIFHLSVGGHALRVHISNAFGTEALHFTSVHVARPLSPSSSAIELPSDTPLSFAGCADVTVPPGAEFISDPLEFPDGAVIGSGCDVSSEIAANWRNGSSWLASDVLLRSGRRGERSEPLGTEAGGPLVSSFGNRRTSFARRGAVVALGDSITGRARRHDKRK